MSAFDPATGTEAGLFTGARSRLGRSASYLLTVFVLVSLTFLLPRLMPGDPLSALFTAGTPTHVENSALRAELAAYYGLDAPLWQQYVDYLAGLAQGELGTSIRFNVPVASLVAQRLPWTLLLIGMALPMALAVGLVGGVQSAWHRGRSADQGLLAVFLAFRGFPAFFLASIGLFVFAVQLDWVPLTGATSRFAGSRPLWQSAIDVAHHLVLPATVLAAQFAAGYFLLMRGNMIGELGADYLLWGRAKGLRRRRLKYHPYAARNALLPVITLAGLHAGAAVTGAVVIEVVFAYPGMGRLIFEAVSFRDYPVLQACFLFLSLVVVTANFLADLAYTRLDPRTAA